MASSDRAMYLAGKATEALAMLADLASCLHDHSCARTRSALALQCHYRLHSAAACRSMRHMHMADSRQDP